MSPSLLGVLWEGGVFPLPKEVEEDEAFGLGDGLAEDLVFWFVLGLAGAVP